MTGSFTVARISRSWSCVTRRSPWSSSITKVKLRSLAAWLTRWIFCSSNSSKASPSLWMMARMLRPSSDSDAQGPMTRTRHSFDRSPTSSSIVSASRVLACGSSDTVTLVSEVETRSTDRPWSLNTRKASARKPTWCHMPGLSIETSVMPRLSATALTWAPLSAGCALMTVPGWSGAVRGVDVQRDGVLAHRQDAARMQHLGAAGRDFLRLVVVQRLQQACGRHVARVRREHSRHVGPDLQTRGGRYAPRCTPRRCRSRRARAARCVRPRRRR